MLALIIGDSQAQGAGAYLQKELEAQGYTVKRASKPGGGSADVAALAQAWADLSPQLVVAFSGSTASKAVAVKTVAEQWPNAKKVWYGSSPATTITNLPAARAKFGKSVTAADHWFTNGEAKDREARNAELRDLVSQAGMAYVDWRQLTLTGAVVQPSGVTFPNQADGIHVLGASAAAAFAAPNWPNGAAAAPQSGQFAILAIIVFAIIVLRG